MVRAFCVKRQEIGTWSRSVTSHVIHYFRFHMLNVRWSSWSALGTMSIKWTSMARLLWSLHHVWDIQRWLSVSWFMFSIHELLHISDSDGLAGVLGCGHQHKDTRGLDCAGGRGGQGAPRAGEEPPQASRHRCQCQRQPEWVLSTSEKLFSFHKNILFEHSTIQAWISCWFDETWEN